ncbi:hypothetical protein EGR_08163 [Echinococcus granulosus]|uniref:Uncharacterized protein n=1 Tax=Echinococcus granulosus TaxID=6210 RepID=W6UFZ6_ECHGR|nr:hypothetical protein EGR_08163 [Echinococcus granulosus]EUB57012.1 hypothetical protein EGR_08163 [Echinococcus granulosus]
MPPADHLNYDLPEEAEDEQDVIFESEVNVIEKVEAELVES